MGEADERPQGEVLARAALDPRDIGRAHAGPGGEAGLTEPAPLPQPRELSSHTQRLELIVDEPPKLRVPHLCPVILVPVRRRSLHVRSSSRCLSIRTVAMRTSRSGTCFVRFAK